MDILENKCVHYTMAIKLDYAYAIHYISLPNKITCEIEFIDHQYCIVSVMHTECLMDGECHFTYYMVFVYMAENRRHHNQNFVYSRPHLFHHRLKFAFINKTN